MGHDTYDVVRNGARLWDSTWGRISRFVQSNFLSGTGNKYVPMWVHRRPPPNPHELRHRSSTITLSQWRLGELGSYSPARLELPGC